MNTIPYQLMQSKFNEKFLNFDHQDYEKVSSNRERNQQGHYKASALILEITKLSAFFASEKVRTEMSNIEASVLAFIGWQLSYHHNIYADNSTLIENQLKKYSKNALTTIRKLGHKTIKLHEITWIIFCCAMLREKFYRKFPYNLKGFSLREDENDERIDIAYSIENCH